ncbi:MAG: DUF2079 domain-containing protein [Euryarchaeota archaeon]|nr:DUF2079 domain-containing protein [Euryarchaeota archaeon]
MTPLDPGGATQQAGGPLDSMARLVRRILRRPYLVLLGGMVFYVIATVTIDELRVLELQATTWDLGLYQQALWSVGHGRPLYEAADFEVAGYPSFLEVHTSFVLFAVAPVYDALPSPLTLFTLQSIVVAGAAIPLYLLSREVVGRGPIALTPPLLFLCSAAVIGSSIYDFHVEAFLPVEFFTFFLLWYRRQYAWGAAVAVVALLTMEIAPVLMATIALVFLLPSRDGLRGLLQGWRSSWGSQRLRELLRPLGAQLRWYLLDRRHQVSAALLLASIVSYYFLRFLQSFWIQPLLGLPPISPIVRAPGEGVIGASPGLLGVGLGGASVDPFGKLSFWIITYALLGLVPLLSLRGYVLAFPWWIFTVFNTNANFSIIGFQYGYIFAIPLMLSFIFGLRRLQGWWQETSTGAQRRASPVGLRRPSRGTVAVTVTALVAVNLLMSPLDPVLHDSGQGAAYQFSYEVPPGYSDVTQLVSLIPPGAVVLASDNLFPLVANNLHAYSLYWDPNQYPAFLPFSSAELPRYVLISENRDWLVPSWLDEILYSTGDYGVVGIVEETPVGGVILFESGYHGPALLLGGPVHPLWAWTPAALLADPATNLLAAPGTPYNEALWGMPGETTHLWDTPAVSLPVGNYSMDVLLAEEPMGPGAPPTNTSSVLFLHVEGFAGDPDAILYVPHSLLRGGGWTSIVLNFTIGAPAIGVQIAAYQLDPGAGIETAAVSLHPS